MLQFSVVQTAIVNGLFRELKAQTKVEISVHSIDLNFTDKLVAQQVLIKDHQQDTLIYTQNLEASYDKLLSLFSDKMVFNKVKITNGFLNSVKYKGEDKYSLMVFADRLKPKTPSKKPLELYFSHVILENVGYKQSQESKTFVNYQNVSGNVYRLAIKGSNVALHSEDLTFDDIYGIHYQKLTTDYEFADTHMSLKNTYLKTNHSQIKADVNLSFKGNDMLDFVNKVRFDAKIYDSNIHTRDLTHFYPIKKQNFSTSFELKGMLNDFRLHNIKVKSSDYQTVVVGNLAVKNGIHNQHLLKIYSTNLSVKSNTNLLVNYLPLKYQYVLPSNYYDLQNFDFQGSINIQNNKFRLSGNTQTNLGNAQLNLDYLKSKDDSQILNFEIKNGVVFSNKQLPAVKEIYFQTNGVLNVSPEDEIDLVSRFSVPTLKLKTTNIHQIAGDFSVQGDNSILNFAVHDPNLAFKGHVVQKKNNSQKDILVDFDIENSNLKALFPNEKLFQETLSSKGSFKVNYTNNQHFLVDGFLNDAQIGTSKETIDLSNISINYQKTVEHSKMAVHSNQYIDLNVDGNFNFSNVNEMIQNALYRFIPGDQSRFNVENQDLNLNITIYPQFVSSLTNKFQIYKAVELDGSLSTKSDKGYLKVKIPFLKSGNIAIDSLQMLFDNSNSFINTKIVSKRVVLDKQAYTDVSFLGKKVNDTLFVRSDFVANSRNNSATVYVTSQNQKIGLGIESLNVDYLDAQWELQQNKANQLYYNTDTGMWDFKEIAIVNNAQSISVDGFVNNNGSKNLRIGLQNVDLNQVTPTIQNLAISGIATGEVFFKDHKTIYQPEGILKIVDLKINQIKYGNLVASVLPTNEDFEYLVDFQIEDAHQKSINAHGSVALNRLDFNKTYLDLMVNLDNLALNSLSPLGKNVLSKVRGFATGKFSVIGNLNDINFYGGISLAKAGLNFPYLNVDYNFKDNSYIKLNGKQFEFDKVKLFDSVYNSNGSVSGDIKFDNYFNWYLNLKINADNLLALNTFQTESSSYYGTGFLKGYATIVGPTDNIKINVVGKTLKNSKFVLPLSDVSLAEENKFIYFKEKTSNSVNTNQDVKDLNEQFDHNSGLEISLNLEITKDVLSEIVIDQSSGSSLVGRTNGRLLIDIDKLFQINMYGDLIVEEGIYNYKYGNVINKPFEVKKGGVISWNGDPFKALLDISAVHNVKANPKVLLENLTINRKVDVDLITRVTGELFDSKQDFEISLPNVSTSIVQEISFKINIDENTKMRQFFSLLVSKSFYDENNVNNSSSVFSSTTSELVSRVVTDLFNKEEDKFHVNFGYSSGNSSNSNVNKVAVNNQLDIGLATDINDRILINGKLGVPVGGSTSANAQSTIVGEVKIEFLLNEDGSLRSTVFNRQNQIQYSQEEQGYTQGTGLSYQIDFVSFKDLLQKTGIIRRKTKPEVKSEVPSKKLINDNLKFLLPDLL